MATPFRAPEAVVKSTEDYVAIDSTQRLTNIQPKEQEEKRDTPTVQAPTSSQSIESTYISKPPTLPDGISGQASPALSGISTLSALSASPTPQPFGFDGAAQSIGQASGGHSGDQTDQPPPAKRRKLTPAEKEERRQEKEVKAREKAEQKAKRDEEKREEKRVKEEEKKAKDEIKDKKKQEKEREKLEKEREKQRILDEKEKKERAQPKLHSFFAKPSTPTRPSVLTEDHPLNEEEARDSMDNAAKALPQLNDYRRTFLPFSLPLNTTWAPASQFTWDNESKRHVQRKIDDSFGENYPPCVNLRDSIGFCMELGKPRGITHETVRDLVLRLGGDRSNPVDLTGSRPDNPMKSLQKIPMRYIHFQEDVRPPYIGTYTKVTQKDLVLTARNPFRRSRPDTNYDYDSEAEWEELEEGDEDLMSEGESELESNDGADEMDDFLDDEDAEAQLTRKKIISSDLEPSCSGLCWESAHEMTSDQGTRAMQTSHMKLALLQDCLKFPLDPFSSQYWPESHVSKAAAKQNLFGSMQPPRQPLQDRPNMFLNVCLSADHSTTSVDFKTTKPAIPSTLRLLTGSELEKFKQAVQGSEHTKAGLTAILKKQFRNVPVQAIKDTLSTYAERVGETEDEKRWTIKEDGNPPVRDE